MTVTLNDHAIMPLLFTTHLRLLPLRFKVIHLKYRHSGYGDATSKLSRALSKITVLRLEHVLGNFRYLISGNIFAEGPHFEMKLVETSHENAPV